VIFKWRGARHKTCYTVIYGKRSDGGLRAKSGLSHRPDGTSLPSHGFTVSSLGCVRVVKGGMRVAVSSKVGIVSHKMPEPTGKTAVLSSPISGGESVNRVAAVLSTVS